MFFDGFVDDFIKESHYDKLSKKPESKRVLTYYLFGLESEEIAANLGKAAQTVRIQLNEMRRHLDIVHRGNLRVFVFEKLGVDYKGLTEKFEQTLNQTPEPPVSF